jgi:hypothetical protein
MLKRPLDLHRQVSLRIMFGSSGAHAISPPGPIRASLQKVSIAPHKGLVQGVETRQLAGQTYAARAQKTLCPASQVPA